MTIPRRPGPLVGALVLCAALAPSGAQEPSPAAPGEYVIGVEDKLEISVWREADLARTVVVRPDGKVTFFLIGDVVAAGRTARQLDEEITEGLSRFIREPVVTVIVTEIEHFKVFVLGEVAAQGVLTLKRRTRLLEAIAQAGGLTPFADKSNVVLVREEGGREVRQRIDYKKILSGERPESNVFLKPGDTILVN